MVCSSSQKRSPPSANAGASSVPRAGRRGGQRRGGVLGLRPARRLGHAQGDPAGAGHDQRVVHVDGVDLAVERGRDLDLGPEVRQQRAERLVLARQPTGSGVRQPAPAQSPAVAGRRTRTRRSGATIDVTP